MNKVEFDELFTKVVEEINSNKEYENIYYNYYFDEKEKIVLVFNCNADEDKIEKLLEEKFNIKLSDLESEGHLYTTYNDDCYHCDCCGYLIHINHYVARNNHWIAQDGVYCKDCVKNELKDNYIDFLTNSVHSANTLLTEKELKEYGYNNLDLEYNYGLHNLGEVSNTPAIVLEKLKYHGYDNVIFSITGSDMFNTSYTVYVKTKEEE